MSNYEQSLLPEISKRVDIARSVLALKHIQCRYVSATPAQKVTYLPLFNAFLDEALTQEGFVDRLDEISLLNRAGDWRQASELAIEGHNIAPTSLLNETQFDIFKKHRTSTSKSQDSQMRPSILNGEGFDESQISLGIT